MAPRLNGAMMYECHSLDRQAVYEAGGLASDGQPAPCGHLGNEQRTELDLVRPSNLSVFPVSRPSIVKNPSVSLHMWMHIVPFH